MVTLDSKPRLNGLEERGREMRANSWRAGFPRAVYLSARLSGRILHLTVEKKEAPFSSIISHMDSYGKQIIDGLLGASPTPIGGSKTS